jgi:hypothetical protein
MKLKNTSNWSNIAAFESLLFFAQRLDELLFDYTLDTYKSPALNPPFLCKEALDLITEIEAGSIDAQNLIHVLEELEWSIRNDPAAKQLIGLDISSFFLGEEAKNQLHKQRNLLEIIQKSIHPDIYLLKVQEDLLTALNNNKKNDINRLSRTWVTTLTNLGVTKKHLFQTTEKFFFGNQSVTSIEDAKRFFLVCMPVIHSFEVYFIAKKDLSKFSNTLSIFSIEILDKLPDDLIQIAHDHQFIAEADEILIKVSNINSFDIHSGRREAEQTLDRVRDLILLYSHKKPITWSPTTIVTQCCLESPVIAVSPKSSVQMISDLRPSIAASRLQFMLENMSITDGNDRERFDRIVDLHGLCAIQDAPETQILNLWICIESIIPSEPSRNKINNIIQIASPLLMLTYIRRLIKNLLRDLLEWNKKATRQTLKRIPHESDEWSAIKVLMLLSPEHEELRKELYSKLDDFPLLRHRIFFLSEIFSSKDKVQNLLGEHRKKVEWQIRRIYRTRNLLVHSGRTPSYLSTLIENAHDYLDSMILEILELSCSAKRISTFRQAFELFHLQHNHYEKSIKALTTITSENIATIYHSRPPRKTVDDIYNNHNKLLGGTATTGK